MIKLKAAVLVAGLGLALAGCAKPIDNSQVENIRQSVRSACAFVPTASSVAALLSVFVPTAQPFISTADQIAQAICVEANKSGARRGGRPTLRVQGVVVRGEYVR